MLFSVLAGFHGLLMDGIASHILTKIKQKQSLSSCKGGAHHENQAMLFRTFAVYIKLGVSMGAFYTNVTVRTVSPEKVLPFLKGRNAFVSPSSGGYVTIFDEQCDEGGLYPNEFASSLSRQFSTTVFLVTVHDDDVLYFDVFEDGERRDEYDSCPNYFNDEDEEDVLPEGGNPQALCDLFGCEDVASVEHVLYTQDEDADISIFATERHRALAELLHLPSFSVGYGYKYIARGEEPDGLVSGELIHVLAENS